MTYPERALSGPHFSENHELKNEAFLFGAEDVPFSFCRSFLRIPLTIDQEDENGKKCHGAVRP